MHFPVLPELTPSSSLPLSQSLSLVYCSLALIVVVDLRSSCESVTERDEFVGRISGTERFPQYCRG